MQFVPGFFAFLFVVCTRIISRPFDKARFNPRPRYPELIRLLKMFQILKSAYSFYAVLRQMNADVEIDVNKYA